MVVFHSYVSLPEGMSRYIMLQHIKQINTNAQRSERAATYETGIQQE